MARYILTHKRARQHVAEDLRDSRRLLETALRTIPQSWIYKQAETESPNDRRIVVLEVEPREIAAFKKTLPKGLLLEREILHKLHASPTAGPAAGQSSTRALVRGARLPLGAARITLLFEDGGAINALPWGFTGIDGRAELIYDNSVNPLFLIAEPEGGFWGMFKESPPSNARFTCPSLPRATPLAWWHHAVGVNTYDPLRGQGIRIGVVGTGVGPHPRLQHVVLIDGKPDIERHETHVCGILTARPNGPGEFAGIAPGASVFSARVFNLDPDGQPIAEDQGVIAQTIERLARGQTQNGFAADLINLSFGQPDPSQILRDAIQWAFEEGTLCISSAGNNSGGPLDYPAAFRETVAVSALGKVGWGPRGSTGTHWIPTAKGKFGHQDLYLAAMSSVGSGIDCAAPGNGIISTIPRSGLPLGGGPAGPAPYAAMDGTSLASPMACGVLAALLSNLPAYRALPRTAARARMARTVLQTHTHGIGLRSKYVGKGLPTIV